MARILSHPFRIAANGAVAAVEQDSEQADREQIAMLILTKRGERPLAPGFGITDPTFDRVSASEVTAGVALYGPPVNVTEVLTTITAADEQLVEVRFE